MLKIRRKRSQDLLPDGGVRAVRGDGADGGVRVRLLHDDRQRHFGGRAERLPVLDLDHTVFRRGHRLAHHLLRAVL